MNLLRKDNAYIVAPVCMCVCVQLEVQDLKQALSDRQSHPAPPVHSVGGAGPSSGGGPRVVEDELLTCIDTMVQVCVCVCVLGGAVPRVCGGSTCRVCARVCVYECLCLSPCVPRPVCVRVYALYSMQYRTVDVRVCMCVCVSHRECPRPRDVMQYKAACVCMCVCVCVCHHTQEMHENIEERINLQKALFEIEDANLFNRYELKQLEEYLEASACTHTHTHTHLPFAS